MRTQFSIVRADIIRPLLTAVLMLAITFTFSCSDDSGGGNGNPSLGTVADNLSSSSLGSTSNGNDDGPLKKDKISGFSQKGPFTKGSAITLSELNYRFAQTGRSFEEMITDDKGSFEIKNIELVSPYVILKANGFYRNEIFGEISKAPINLYAIADIREKSNVNVNILTHLEYYRVQKLVEGGKSLKDAKKQAQREILAVFNISGDFKDSEDMSIFGTTDSDAALLAISVLLQGELSEGQFTERLADFSVKFRETGTWDNSKEKDAMAEWAFNDKIVEYCNYAQTLEDPKNCYRMPTDDMCRGGRIVSNCPGDSGPYTVLSLTKNNILNWNFSSTVPDFEKYVNNYWNAYYGVCPKEEEVKTSQSGNEYVCRNGEWKQIGPQNTPCGDKTIYIKLPEGWGSSTYIMWEGKFIAITGTKEGTWTKFTIPTNLPNDGPAKSEIIFADYNDYYNNAGVTHFVTKQVFDKGKSILLAAADIFKCSDFGDNGTWLIEEPNNPGKTLLLYLQP